MYGLVTIGGDGHGAGRGPTLLTNTAQSALLAQFPGVTWTVDAQLRLTSWAGRALHELGHKAADFIGCGPEEFKAIAPDQSAVVEAHLKALQGAAATFDISWGDREFSVRVEPLLGEDGDIVGCVGVGIDVTERNGAAAKVAMGERFRLALTGLIEEFLAGGLEDDLFHRVLDVAVDAVPGAQAGSVWLRDPARAFRAVAAHGADLAALEGLRFSEDEMRRGAPNASELQAGLAQLGREDEAKLARLRAAGPIDKIRSTLSFPVTVRGETAAYFHLHSFECEAAFGPEAAQMARVFAGQLGAMLQRARLERGVRDGRKQVDRLLEDYRQLASFGAEIEVIHDTDMLIETGMERLLLALAFDTAMFGDVRPDGVHFTRIRGISTPQLEETLRTPLPLGAGINGRVAITGKPLFIEDYRAWAAGHQAYLPSGVESMLSLPVMRGGRVQHTISFATLNRKAKISKSHARTARGFVARLENAFERVQYLQEIEATREATFRSLGLALEYRDLETRGHTDRVVDLAWRFARRLDLEPAQRQALSWGAYLHDIGKIAVPDTILLKPGKLTEEEFDVIRQHTLYGAQMTRDIPFLPTETRQIVRSHHERWDGRGYPDGLARNEIPLLARMFSLVDVYDALTSERPYKRAWSEDEAAAELERQRGAQFDPDLVGVFVAALQDAPAA